MPASTFNCGASEQVARDKSMGPDFLAIAGGLRFEKTAAIKRVIALFAPLEKQRARGRIK